MTTATMPKPHVGELHIWGREPQIVVGHHAMTLEQAREHAREHAHDVLTAVRQAEITHAAVMRPRQAGGSTVGEVGA